MWPLWSRRSAVRAARGGPSKPRGRRRRSGAPNSVSAAIASAPSVLAGGVQVVERLDVGRREGGVVGGLTPQHPGGIRGVVGEVRGGTLDRRHEPGDQTGHDRGEQQRAGHDQHQRRSRVALDALLVLLGRLAQLHVLLALGCSPAEKHSARGAQHGATGQDRGDHEHRRKPGIVGVERAGVEQRLAEERRHAGEGAQQQPADARTGRRRAGARGPGRAVRTRRRSRTGAAARPTSMNSAPFVNPWPIT